MNVIITGASRGIGAQTAIALSKKGVSELVLISRNKLALEKVKAECLSVDKSIKVIILSEDLTVLTNGKNNSIADLNWKKCDVLINNAGYLVNKSFAEMQEEDVSKMFEVNVLAPSRLIGLCIELLKKSKKGHVLNIGSMGGYQGSSKYPGLSYYSASKAALASITECLSEEYKESNISFNCLALGAVQTEMLNEAFPGLKAPVSAKEMGEYIADFALTGPRLYNGKILPVTVSNP